MHKLKQFWQSLENNEKFMKKLAMIELIARIFFGLFLIWFLASAIYCGLKL